MNEGPARLDLFDTHCHLADPDYEGDLDQVLARAWQAGLVGLVCVGYDLESSRAAVALASRDRRVRAAVGLHPHCAKELKMAGGDFTARLRDLAQDPRVVAIGETGLDFYRDLSPRPAQMAAFRAQVETALDLGLPLIVHDRDAHEQTLALLREYYGPDRGSGEARAGVLHCFSGSLETALGCLELGFSISFAGPLTYPKADRARAVAAAVPWERLLVETDAPYLAPQSRRGRRNEPALVAEVVAALAAVKGTTLERAAAETTANARRLFDRAP